MIQSAPMTIAELLIALCILALLRVLLRPLQHVLENTLLKLFGARGPHVIDVSVIKEKKNHNSKE